jgi:hypothetical protein
VRPPPQAPPETHSAAPEFADWLAEQPVASLHARVQLLLEGRGQEAERGARQAFLAWQAKRNPHEVRATRRSVADIEQGVAGAREQRLAIERRLQAAAEAKQRAKRAARQADLVASQQQTWQQIDALLTRGTGSAYDQALQRTRELAEALQSHGSEQAFHRGLVRLLATHGKRPAWVARLEKAGLLSRHKR